MLKISDKKFFCEIVADALAQTHLIFRRRKALRNRWIKAIAGAAALILEGDTSFLHWNPDADTLYYWSPKSNEIHQTGEECQCPAFLQSKLQPCYHRAMHDLVKKYFELQQKPNEVPRIDFADAVFFDGELTTRQKSELLGMCISEGRSELKPLVEALEKHFI
jgi:hypothetical protein